ncbi:unnamed protein product [Darwinula stevensoni]|uniref:Signal peptidase complex subunit 3 n=1 Tax=Darwinula stevensoni TaxID=69355 RepID=A0A7R8X339_9CRUS|nr:unnamed protein product [Darwinula stevensoni]CAG0884100.1 unnamed protein product [Darwinula stevensoni]
MNTIWSRMNAMFAFFLSVLSAVTFICFLSTFFNPYTSSLDIKTLDVFVRNVADFSAGRDKNDLGFLRFNLKADILFIDFLTDLVLQKPTLKLLDFQSSCCLERSSMNIEPGQLFIYLTAEYKTSTSNFDQVVLWDKIILRGDNASFDLKQMNTKYYFFDDGNGLKGNDNVTLTLRWNVIPNAGYLPLTTGSGSHSFAFPKSYHQTQAPK